ncbi:MAG: hypothetical protein QMD73_04990 [Rhodocyclaceae bacterium]|nr:hypothetical protein [Rhodocyclaceae bacterium]
MPSHSTKFVGRVLLLAGCIFAGCIIGFVGQYLTGSSSWFLAVPALMALAWLFVANPDECLPDGQCRRRNDSA